MKSSVLTTWAVLPLAALLAGGVALADEDDGPGKSEKAGAKEGKAKSGSVLAALRLPVAAQKARGKGVPTKEVRKAIRALRKSKVKPKEATAALEETSAAVDEAGPVENFGDFVQSKLDEGLRGRELAKAIHDEHRRRGIGKGKRLRDDEGDAHGRKHGEHRGHEKHADKKAHRAEREAARAAEKAERKADKSERKEERKASKAAGKSDKKKAKHHMKEHSKGKPSKGKGH